MAVFRPLIFLLLLQLGQVLAKPYDYNGSRKPVLFPQPADNQIGKMVMRPSLINNSEEHQAVLPGRSGAGTEPTKSFPVMSLYDNPITVNPPHSMFGRIGNHPVSRGNILDNPDLAVGTNKFYANPYLGSQTQATWTLPYQLVYTKGGGFNGVAVNHIDSRLVSLGPNPMADPVQYYFNAVGHKNIVFSAREIDDSASVTIDSTTHLSANLNLHANRARDGDFANKITFSMVQGMGFVTARYYGLTPVIGSGDFIRQIIVYDENNRPSGCQKFHILLNDNTKWLLYAYPEQGSPNLELASHGGGEGYVSLVSPNRFTGFIQLAKLLTGHDEATFDYAAGAFPTTATMSATVSGISGAYSLNFKPYGTNKANELLMFALPHHYQSFDANTREGVTPLYMRSPTKGMMKGYLRSNWTMVEPNLPVSLSWLPGTMSNAVQQAVANMAANELNDISADKNQMGREITLSGGSMYFSGKLLAKYGNIILALALTGLNNGLARSKLAELETAFSQFYTNLQSNTLKYDTKWKGLVSDSVFKSDDPGVDFGNGRYNDHHFHYGYHIYTAALIGYLHKIFGDGDGWLNANKRWVNDLIRDVHNPSDQDKYFPVSRSFDWFHGHSWAKGLFESADGKDEESSSEDINFAFSMKLWGMVSGDATMEARGNLMMAILKRTINRYMLIESTNTIIHPEQFLKNKVTGILFENKVDHATYFGMNPEFIQGIHMLPITPAMPYVRSTKFVQEEWEVYFDKGRAENAVDGWKSILMGNYAIINAEGSWNWFSVPRAPGDIDGGLSQTWGLAHAGTLGAMRRSSGIFTQ